MAGLLYLRGIASAGKGAKKVKALIIDRPSCEIDIAHVDAPPGHIRGEQDLARCCLHDSCTGAMPLKSNHKDLEQKMPRFGSMVQDMEDSKPTKPCETHSRRLGAKFWKPDIQHI